MRRACHPLCGQNLMGAALTRPRELRCYSATGAFVGLASATARWRRPTSNAIPPTMQAAPNAINAVTAVPVAGSPLSVGAAETDGVAASVPEVPEGPEGAVLGLA